MPDNAYVPVPTTARRELIEGTTNLPLDLEPIDPAIVESKVYNYSPDPRGLDQLSEDILNSSDPQVIHLLLFLGDNFRTKLVTHFSGQERPSFKLKFQIETAIEDIIKKFLRIHPELFTLFATEFYKLDPEHFRKKVPGDLRVNRTHDLIAEYYTQDNQEPAVILSRAQFEHLTDTLVAYCARSQGGGEQQTIEAQFLSRFDPEYVARKITTRLHDAKNLSPTAEHRLVCLLSSLDVAPAAIADGSCDYLGTHIQLDNLPAEANHIERLSVYGDIAVMNAVGEIIGEFSMHTLQPAEQETFVVLVRELELEDLFFQTQAEGDLSQTEKVDLAREFKTAYRRYSNDDFFKKCQRPLHTFPLKEQVGLVRLLRSGDTELIQTVQRCVYDRGSNILRALAIVYVYGGNLRDLMTTHPGAADLPMLKPVLEPAWHEDGQLLSPLDYFVHFVKQAETEAGVLYTELRRQFPDIELNVEDISRGLIKSAQTALLEINTEWGANEYFKSVQDHATEVDLGLTFFREVIGLIQTDDVDLHDFVRRQQALTRLVDGNPILHGALVDVLLQCQKLKPDPELFWRVDRELREYNDRTGIRVTDLAKTLAIGSAEKEIFFESGAGAGRGIAERTTSLSGQYYDFSINNNVYYPLRKLLSKCIDFEALQLPAAERDDFVDYIFKVLYLVEGAGGGDAITDVTALHDQAAITSLTADPNNLKKLLATVGSKLQLAEAVPSEYGIQPQADGSKVYPNKIRWREQSKTFQAAIEKFQANPASGLRPDLEQTDLKQAIPIFPIGMTIGDFTEINKLADNQIKCGVDVRALMYLEGEDYITTLVTLGHKLKDGAVYVSDSVRENFGKVYRLPELRRVEQELGAGYTLYVVTGPGVPGDDYNQTAAVRSVVITKGNVPENLLHDHLTSGAYNLSPLDAVLIDEPYLRSLDADGANLGRLQAAA